MNFLIVGLGNPGEEYNDSRHNAGRIFLENLRKANGFSEWKENKYAESVCSKGKIGKNNVELVLPETFMNRSGKSVVYILNKNKIKPNGLIVVYDDLDLPLGKFKISFNRGSGGHKGVESIARSLKTKEFTRIRIGISPAGRSGAVRKPRGEKNVADFILGKFRKPELEELKKVSEDISKAVEMMISESLEKAMGEWNGK